MHKIWKVLASAVAVAVVSAPAVARADGYISPFVGTNFGSNSGNGRTNVGADLGAMGHGVIGVELDFGYAPSFFGSSAPFGSNSVTDFMGNVIIGIPTGGQKGAGVRPYGTIGTGLLRTQINGATSAAASITNNDAGLNAGAGVMGYFSNHLGIRGDVRYFRNLSHSNSVNGFNVDFGAFHFWRASIGIIIRP